MSTLADDRIQVGAGNNNTLSLSPFFITNNTHATSCSPIQRSCFGDLSNTEVKQIQSCFPRIRDYMIQNTGLSPTDVDEIMEEFYIDVGGSAAKGGRRNCGRFDLPHGKGVFCKSDIDYIVPEWSQKVIQSTNAQYPLDTHFGLPEIDKEWGLFYSSNPDGSVIRFTPDGNINMIPGATKSAISPFSACADPTVSKILERNKNGILKRGISLMPKPLRTGASKAAGPLGGAIFIYSVYQEGSQYNHKECLTKNAYMDAAIGQVCEDPLGMMRFCAESTASVAAARAKLRDQDGSILIHESGNYYGDEVCRVTFKNGEPKYAQFFSHSGASSSEATLYKQVDDSYEGSSGRNNISVSYSELPDGSYRVTCSYNPSMTFGWISWTGTEEANLRVHSDPRPAIAPPPHNW